MSLIVREHGSKLPFKALPGLFRAGSLWLCALGKGSQVVCPFMTRLCVATLLDSVGLEAAFISRKWFFVCF